MTSESDSTSGRASGGGAGRRPPTIELTATEVEQPRDSATSKPADAAAKAERAASAEQAEPGDASKPKAGARRGVHPLAHIVSAVIGAIAATAVLLGLWLAGFTVAHDEVNSQLADTASPNAGNAEITARLDKIEHALQAQKPPPAPSVPTALANRLAAVEMQAKMLGDSTAALNHRVDEIATTAQTAQKQATTSAASAADAAKNAGQAGVQRSDLDALTDRITALESTVKTLSERMAHPMIGVDQRVRLSVAAQALRTAVDAGVPYQAELKAVQSLGADQSATAPLQTFAASGLPRADTLAHALAALVPALRAAANPTSGEMTFIDKLKANARKLVDITPVDAPPGNDPAAVITRIDVNAKRGDIAAALKDVAALPDRLKSLTADWAKTAQAREKALTASRDISADALAALSKPAAQ